MTENKSPNSSPSPGNSSMNRTVIPFISLLLLCEASCRQKAFNSFSAPQLQTSNDVARVLKIGMTKSDVMNTVGLPDFESKLEGGVTSATYLLEPSATSSRPKNSAFAGFEVFFKGDRVIQWNAIHSSTVLQRETGTPAIDAGAADPPAEIQVFVT